jgi:hypothetical protein
MDDRTGGIYPGHFESRLEEEDPALIMVREWARELNLDGHSLLQHQPGK